MRNLIGAVALSSLLICAPGLAQPQVPATDARAKTAPQRTCKTLSETGSRVKKRKVCLTVKQRDEIALNAERLAREMQTLISTESGN